MGMSVWGFGVVVGRNVDGTQIRAQKTVSWLRARFLCGAGGCVEMCVGA